MRELQRGAVRLHVLHHAAQHDVHGTWLAEELARHGYEISFGTLYPLLHRMESEGLLESHDVVHGRQRRRAYRVTSTGLQSLADGRRVLRELAEEILGDNGGA